jgi:outer membrane protein OmpA-like peptidoglycan-associated protein
MVSSKKYCVLLLFCLFSISSFAKELENKEDELNLRYSIFGSYIMNEYNASFPNLPEVPSCCPFYQNGDGRGFSLGAGFDYELPYSLFVGLRIAYADLSGSFLTQETTSVRIDDKVETGMFEHVIEANLHEIAFQPILTYSPFKNFELYAGGHVGVMVARNYVHYEKLILPKDRGVFVDTKSRTRNYSEGEIPQSNIVNGSFVIGLSYLFPMNDIKTLFIAPEFFYTQGLSNVAKNTEWKINTFRLGLSIKYFPKEITPEPFKVEPPREDFRQILVLDTLVIESDKVIKTELKKGQPTYDRDEQLTDNTLIITEITKRVDTLYTRPDPEVEMSFSTPVINIQTHYVTEAFLFFQLVFFKHDSPDIIDFHDLLEPGSDFSTNDLETNPVLFNKEILNIIGERLSLNTEATISVKAFADSITEKGNCDLAIKRAEKIRDYLSSVWKIDPGRIDIDRSKKNCTPYQPTFSENDSGFAENRRAVIMSDSPDILAPIHRERYSEVVKVEPEVIELDPKGTTEIGIKDWEIIGVQDGREIFRKKGTGKPQLVTEEITNYKADALMEGNKLDIVFNVTDVEGNKGSETKTIKIIKDVSELEVERLSLILFDVSSDRIPEHAKPGIENLMESLNDSTKVRIIGYSDVLGPFDFNKELSEKRAKKTEQLVRTIVPNANIVEMKGVGSLEFPPGIHSYQSPTERFLSRTVRIDLIKKVPPEELLKQK